MQSTRTLSLTWVALILVPLLLIGIFYVAPVFNLFRISFAQYDPKVGVVFNYSLEGYASLFQDPFYWEVLWRTIRLSLITTAACVILGYPIAIQLVRSSGWRQTILFIVLLMPLVTSVTVMSYGWLILLGRNGLINSILLALGITDAPQQLMYNETVIVIGLVHVLIIFMVISIAASLQSIDPALARAARSLGATPFSTFRFIILPLSMPGLKTGALLVFVLSMSAYAIPTLLGGTRVKFLSYLVYQQAISLYNWPRGAAMAVLLLISTTLILVLPRVVAQVRDARRRTLPGIPQAEQVKVVERVT